MANINIIITDAGIAEIVNAENNGTAPVVWSEVGYGTGQYTPSATQTALRGEFKRIDTISGGGAGDNILHITAEDSSNDAYSVYEIGVFTETGTLFAVCSQSTPIIAKAAAASALIALDIVLSNVNPDSVTVGDTNFVLNAATTEKQGIIELATDAEAKAKTDTHRAITPATLDKVIEGHSNIVHRSGAETIAGSKTFTNTSTYKADINFKSNVATDLTKESTVNELWYGDRFVDNNGIQGAAVQYHRNSNGYAEINMQVKSKSSNGFSSLAIIQTKDGISYATAPTPAAGDNSTKIATTAWVTTKAKEYLPLAGGTMKGDISASSEHFFIQKTTSTGNMVFRGGADLKQGGAIALYGKDNDSNEAGSVHIEVNGDSTKVLKAYPSGILVWDDKNIVRSVNNVNANAAGNVTISISNISGLQSALDGKAAASHTHSYLPLAGGTMTGTITMAGGSIKTSNSSGVLYLLGGTSGETGSYIEIAGKDYKGTDSGGYVYLCAKNSTKASSLKLSPDGTLLLNSRNIVQSIDGVGANAAGNVAINALPKSGGTVSGKLTFSVADAIYRNVDNATITIGGGSAWNTGACFYLFGKSYNNGSDAPGMFKITANNGTNSANLIGTPAGALNWVGKDITLGYPNYAAGTKVTASTYTAAADGWVTVRKQLNSTYVRVKVNGYFLMHGGGSDYDISSFFFPVKKGDVITTTLENLSETETGATETHITFYPNR